MSKENKSSEVNMDAGLKEEIEQVLSELDELEAESEMEEFTDIESLWWLACSMRKLLNEVIL